MKSTFEFLWVIVNGWIDRRSFVKYNVSESNRKGLCHMGKRLIEGVVTK